METYKVVKLTNGDNIICETVEHVKESHVIIIADASVGLGAYYKNIVEKRNRLHIPEDVIDFEDNLDDEEMIDRDKINDILEEFIKTNKSKYH